jgi:Flp pilus assembly protein TadG
MVPARVRCTVAADRGASVVEFVLLTVLLVVLLFAVLQVAVWFYARSIVASAAADGAHYAATFDDASDPGGTAGEQRARQLISDGLNARAAQDIPCTGTDGVDAASGLPITTVRCHGRPHMLLLPFDLPLGIDVHSSVLRERSP